MAIKSICGVILTSDRVEDLARFYTEVLGIPLEREEHGGLEIHYGADLGTVHFAIHPPGDFNETTRGHAATKIAFDVDAVAPYIERLRSAGHDLWQDVHDEGFGPMVSFRDPDGNLIELVELRYQFDGPTAP